MAFLRRLERSGVLLALACTRWALPVGAYADDSQPQLLFTSQGKTARMNVDGTGLQYFSFSVANQATWQPGPVFPEGKRLIFLSMEPRRDAPGKPFDKYYTLTPTHLTDLSIRSLMGQQLANPVNSLARCARMSVNHWFLLGWSGDGFFLPYLPGRFFATVGFHTVKYHPSKLNLALD